MLSNHSYNNGNDSNNNNNASSNLNDNRGAIDGNAVSAVAGTVESSAATALSTVVQDSTALGLEQQHQHQLSQIVAAVTDATSPAVVDPYNSLMVAAAAAAAAVRKSVKQEFLSGAGDHVDFAATVKSSTDVTTSGAGN